MNERIDSLGQIIVLVSGKLSDGTEHFAYAAIPPSKYDAFKDAEAKGNYELSEYGEILLHANGLQPTQAQEQQMIEIYGISHLFEEAFQQIRAELKN